MKKLTAPALIFSVLALSACSGGAASVKDSLGLTKQSPDEFAVVKRAPLEMPPDYALRPPQPGAARPQEQSTSDQAKQAVFGGSTTTTGTAPQAAGVSSGANSFLQQAGASVADPSVRQKIDAEAVEYRNANKPVVKKLMGDLGGKDTPSANVVDAEKEAERLRKNKEEGKTVTTGETPYIEE